VGCPGKALVETVRGIRVGCDSSPAVSPAWLAPAEPPRVLLPVLPGSDHLWGFATAVAIHASLQQQARPSQHSCVFSATSTPQLPYMYTNTRSPASPGTRSWRPAFPVGFEVDTCIELHTRIVAYACSHIPPGIHLVCESDVIHAHSQTTGPRWSDKDCLTLSCISVDSVFPLHQDQHTVGCCLA
jgi:hypothetical protein